MLHPFRVPFRGWPVTQGAAPSFALHSALGYFILPFQGGGNVQTLDNRPGGLPSIKGLQELGPPWERLVGGRSSATPAW
jgi:hypothetical protein